MEISTTLLYLILIIIVARTGGEIAERLRQPAVLGEILAGVILGLVPQIHRAIGDQAIIFIAEIGVILLLFEVGLESELDEFIKVGTPAALVAGIGVVLPLAFGSGAAALLKYAPHQALFLGATLTATSVGITARVLRDLRQSQSREAKIVIGAAVVDDVLGLVLLSIVLGIAAPAAARHASPAATIILAVIFLAAAMAVGARAARSLIRLAGRMKGRGILTIAAFAFCLVLAWLGSLAGLAPIVGAFAAGLVLASTEDRVRITERMQPLADIFVPVFFVVVGLHVQLRFLNPADPKSWPTLLLAAILFVVAVGSKLLAGLGAIRQRTDKLLVGIGMVPRGEVGLIFASIGLAAGILTPALYDAVVLVVLLTTLMSPPWLKRRISRVQAARRPPAGSP